MSVRKQVNEAILALDEFIVTPTSELKKAAVDAIYAVERTCDDVSRRGRCSGIASELRQFLNSGALPSEEDLVSLLKHLLTPKLKDEWRTSADCLALMASGWLPASEIAEQFDLIPENLRKRLEYLRKRNQEICIVIEDDAEGRARYLYSIEKIRHILIDPSLQKRN